MAIATGHLYNEQKATTKKHFSQNVWTLTSEQFKSFSSRKEALSSNAVFGAFGLFGQTINQLRLMLASCNKGLELAV